MPPRPPSRREVVSLEGRLRTSYERLGARGRRLLLAVSGGADSTALLLGSHQVALSLDLRLAVAVIDHGLRPEGESEAAAVQALAGTLGLPAHRSRLQLSRGSGLEARARQARYAALEETRQQQGLDWVVTAHTASDQAETLLMRLTRGTALRGAAGVRRRRERVLRPMLDWTREDVLAYLVARGQPFHEDPTNRDVAFLRNRMRSEVLPVLERAAGHEVARKLAGFAAMAAEDDALLSDWAESARERLSLPDGSLDSVGLRALSAPLRRRVVAAFLQERGVGVDLPNIAGTLALLEGGPALPVGKDHTLRVRKGRLSMVPNPPRRAAPETAGQPKV